MNPSRCKEMERALKLLPPIALPRRRGKNGEELATDEAAVWKRVLNYRVATYLRPRGIFESHPGFGISTKLYRHGSSNTRLYQPITLPHPRARVDLVDVDPFGQPWDAVMTYAKLVSKSQVVMVSNGEAYAVVRKWSRSQRFPSRYSGRKMPYWVVNEYLPLLETALGIPCRFFYVFPTTVRSIHSRVRLPRAMFADCPRWMWWLAGHAPKESDLLLHA